MFIELDNTKIELLHPLGDDSPIASFLAKNPSGGMHHVVQVEDILAARTGWSPKGRECSAQGTAYRAHGKPVLFLHPKDFCGTLVELEQV